MGRMRICCWLLAVRATGTVTVVAKPGPLARLARATRDAGTSASPAHAAKGKAHVTGKTGRDHGTRFGGKQCPLLRSTRVSAGLRCTFIADSAQTAVRHLESVRSPRFSRHCTVRTPCITVRTPCIRLQTPYGLRVFSVRAPCVCLRRPNGLPYISNGLDDARFSPLRF